MSDNGTADSFIEKWLQRWPEWSVAEAFVPASQRRMATAWFALLQELTEAAWAGSDPTPGVAKLAWWHEELEGWAKGARRHPLGAELQRLPAPWTRLGRELNVLPATRGQAAEPAMDALATLAAAVSACEQALFADQPATEDRQAAATAATCAALFGARALLTAAKDDAGWLLARWPQPVAGPLPRRLCSALMRGRLDAMAAGKAAEPMSGWRVLATSWRASRGR
ncbi:MAG: phytoene/squalene synthase family protein [Luteimonas sp.]